MYLHLPLKTPTFAPDISLLWAKGDRYKSFLKKSADVWSFYHWFIFILQQRFRVLPIDKLEYYIVTSTIHWEKALVTFFNIFKLHIYSKLLIDVNLGILQLHQGGCSVYLIVPSYSFSYTASIRPIFSKYIFFSPNLLLTFYVTTRSILKFLVF